MSEFLRIFVTGVLVLSLFSCENQKSTNSIRVATASNMQFAITEIAELYSSKYNQEIDIILGSSGKLASQISEGAPFDLYLSADVKHSGFLKDKGLLARGPETYAFGSLVIWSVNGPATIEELGKTRGKIALPNPEIAPYGKAARETLEALDLFESKSPQLVYSESVTQSNQFITSGNAAIGFTAKAVVMAPSQQGTGEWQEIPHDLYEPIEQTASIIALVDRTPPQIIKFYEYLFSEEAKGILEKYGYRLP